MDLIASCSDVVKIWETKNGQLKSDVVVETSNRVTNSCCWTANGHRLITVGEEGHINVFRRNGVPVEHRLHCAENEPLHAVTISPTSDMVAAGGDAGIVEVWNGMEKVPTMMHGSPITCLTFLNSEYRIAAGNEAGRVLLHNLKEDPFTEAPVSLPSFGSHSTVTNVAVKPGDPTLMGVTHSDGAVRFWETETGYCNRDMERKHSRAIMDIGFNPNDPSFVATAGSDGWVRYFDIRTREREGRSTKLTHARVPLTCISFHEEGRRLAVGASNGSIMLIDLRFSSKPVSSEIAYAGPSPPRGGVRGIAFQRTGPSTGRSIDLCSSSSSETYSNYSSRASVSSRSSRGNSDAVTPAVSGKHVQVERSPVSSTARRVSEEGSEAVGDKDYRKGDESGTSTRSQRVERLESTAGRLAESYAERRLLRNPERHVVTLKDVVGCGRRGQDGYRDDDGGDIRVTEEGVSQSPSGSASTTRRQQRRHQQTTVNSDLENASLSRRKAHQIEGCRIDRLHLQEVDEDASVDYRKSKSDAVSLAVSGKHAQVKRSPVSSTAHRVSEEGSDAIGNKDYRKGGRSGASARSQRAERLESTAGRFTESHGERHLLRNPERHVVAPKDVVGCGRRGQDGYLDDDGGGIRVTEEGVSRSPSGSASTTRRQQRRQQTTMNGDLENASLSRRKAHQIEGCRIDRLHLQEVDEDASVDYRKSKSDAVSPAVSGKHAQVKRSPVSSTAHRVSEEGSEVVGDKDYRKRDERGMSTRSQRVGRLESTAGRLAESYAERHLLRNPERHVVTPKDVVGCGRRGQDGYRDDDGDIRVTEEGVSRSPSGSAPNTCRHQQTAMNGDLENASLSRRKAHQSEGCRIDRFHLEQVDEGASVDFRRSNSCPRESTDKSENRTYLRDMLEELFSSHIGAFREELQRELSQLNVDIRRQLHSLQEEQMMFITNYEERFAALLEENRMMRAENARLRRAH